MLSASKMKKDTALNSLAALAQETRLDIFRTLVEYHPTGLPAGKIRSLLKLPGATLSFHLNQLKQANLINVERHGRSLVYTANTNTIDRLAEYLQENCCLRSASISNSVKSSAF